MNAGKQNQDSRNIFLRMHPLQRILISLVLSGITYFLVPRHTSPLLVAMIIWIVFALSYLLTNWIVLFTRTVPEIRKLAKKDDGSIVFVFIMVLLSSFASMFIVLLLMVSKSFDNSEHSLFIFVSIAGILLSWFMVHTIFTFHYAHMYYDKDDKDDKKDAGGLQFPGDEEPDYIDFAYFSFVIGCTFQVSDVEISARSIRRSVLLHGLLSFVLNTFVVALTINLIAGLIK